MCDEIDGRIWVEHHFAFSDAVAGFFSRLDDGFRRLQAIQYQAPWRPASPPRA